MGIFSFFKKQPSADSYRAMLRQSWVVVWQRPAVLVVGFFAYLFIFAADNDLWAQIFSPSRPAPTIANGLGVLESLWSIMLNTWRSLSLFGQQPATTALVVATAVLILIVVLVVMLVGIWAHGGMIIGLSQPERTKLSVVTIAQRAWRFFKQLAIVFISIYAIELILVIATQRLWLATSPLALPWWQDALTVALMVALTLVAVVVAIVGRIAAMIVVTTGASATSAAGSAVQVVRRSLAAALEFSLLLFIVHIIIILTTIVLLQLVAIPFTIIGGIAVALEFSVPFWINAAVGSGALLIVATIVPTVLYCWQWAAWLQWFKIAISDGQVPSRLAQLRRR